MIVSGGYLASTAGGLGMLDLANVAVSTDDFFSQQHDGYSVMHDQSVSGPPLMKHANSMCKSKGRRSKKNQTALLDKSNRDDKMNHRKKSHKKKHRRSKHNHDKNILYKRQYDERSLSTSRRSRSKSSHKTKQYESTPGELLSMSNLSISRDGIRRTQERKKRHHSKSKMSTKHFIRQKDNPNMNQQSSSYIFNI